MPVPLSSRLRRLPEVFECANRWTMGTTIPKPIHISFFCSWPMSSFLRALSAETCDPREDGLRICVRIGATAGRVMAAKETLGCERGSADRDEETRRSIGRDNRRSAEPFDAYAGRQKNRSTSSRAHCDLRQEWQSLEESENTRWSWDKTVIESRLRRGACT